MAEALHVANGHCTTRLIEAAGLPGRTSIWADALHDGPVPDVSDEQLVRIRAEFIADGLDVSAEQVEADLKQWRATVDQDHRYDELVLWFEHDLFDQLNLIQLLSRIGRDRPIRKPVSLVSIDRYPGRPNFKGLGELSPAEIAGLFNTRRRVTPPQFALAAIAWDAFRSGSRARIESLLEDDTSALPFLAAALRRYLEEAPVGSDGLHPNAQSPRVGDPGLTRSERRLLNQLAAGPVDIHTAWRRMHEGESAFYITDTSFWSLLKGLAERTLIDITLSPAAASGLPQGTLSLHS